MPEKFDIIIAGSGFAGSIAALALHNSGFKVCLVEKESHPRFAIGESSTPVADMILRSLSDKYDLPFLKKLSRYGTWQQNYPEILCGIKRGFSYYTHSAGESFETDEKHSNKLLVAASSDDQNSDTNWYRPDFDAFLADKVKEAEIPFFDRTTIRSAGSQKRSALELEATDERTGRARRFQCDLLIDATGSPRLASSLFDVRSSSDGFETDSFALYSHFDDTRRWRDYIEKRGFATGDYPYDPDHSALHHLTEEGWMWNLRFNNELLSAGFAIDRTYHDADRLSGDIESFWAFLLTRYPSIKACFIGSTLSKTPGKIIKTGRMQRRMDRIFGNHWIALNHTAGFVDPLHSTGIAHTLCGLESLLEIIDKSWPQKNELKQRFWSHQERFRQELELVDLLVAGCYKTRMHFDLFHAFTMLYFACTISYEQDRLKGNKPGSFLKAGDYIIQSMVKQSYTDLDTLLGQGSPGMKTEPFIDTIRERIKPYNIAGLLDPDKQNMYRHTAVQLE